MNDCKPPPKEEPASNVDDIQYCDTDQKTCTSEKPANYAGNPFPNEQNCKENCGWFYSDEDKSCTFGINRTDVVYESEPDCSKERL